MTAFWLAVLLAMQPVQDPLPPVEIHGPVIRPEWERPPLPEMPASARGVVQARIRCTAGERGRVENCEIVRLLPERSAFGRSALSAARRARLRDGSTEPGRTFMFEVWACSDVDRPCQRAPWPQD